MKFILASIFLLFLIANTYVFKTKNLFGILHKYLLLIYGLYKF
jgi:hypothetical protein